MTQYSNMTKGCHTIFEYFLMILRGIVIAVYKTFYGDINFY